MRNIRFINIVLIVIIPIYSCKKDPQNCKVDYFFKYDNIQYDLHAGTTYNYKKTDGEFYYISMSGYNGCTGGPAGHGDSTYGVCGGNFIKLNLIGDSMGIMPNNCKVIFDSNSYVMLGYSSPDSFTLKD